MAVVASASAVELVFGKPDGGHEDTRGGNKSEKFVFVGRKGALLSDAARGLLPAACPPPVWTALVESVKAGDEGDQASTVLITAEGVPVTLVAAVLPEVCSRHNSPVRPHAIAGLVGASLGAAASASVVVLLEEPPHAGGAACAIGRAFPTFTAKKPPPAPAAEQKPAPVVRVGFASAAAGALGEEEVKYANCAAAAAAVRRAAHLVDMPTAELTTTAFVAEARAAVERLVAKGREVSCKVISGEALREGGYGLIYAVGKAAEEPPALVVLSHVPTGDNPKKTVVFVGKGIVYDTGGLALKSSTHMCGMKTDMGGAAALFGAFEAAVEIGMARGTALHLLLCLAENAIGPAAVRNDDVVRGLSGLSCEINNTDAEGRLVLADGVAHATALPPRLPGLVGQPDLVVDMATLTGAQGIATGKRHGAIVCNSEEVEGAAVAAGLRSGDTVHPLPYAPECYRKEFKSQVADMKNSVKDRYNAQPSCAASFIEAHLHPEYAGGWLHVDMASPVFVEDRGTGYGVGLMLALLEVDGFAAPAASGPAAAAAAAAEPPSDGQRQEAAAAAARELGQLPSSLRRYLASLNCGRNYSSGRS